MGAVWNGILQILLRTHEAGKYHYGSFACILRCCPVSLRSLEKIRKKQLKDTELKSLSLTSIRFWTLIKVSEIGYLYYA